GAFLVDADVGLLQVGLAGPQRLHLAPDQHEACLEAIGELVVVGRAPIADERPRAVFRHAHLGRDGTLRGAASSRARAQRRCATGSATRSPGPTQATHFFPRASWGWRDSLVLLKLRRNLEYTLWINLWTFPLRGRTQAITPKNP